MLSTLQQIKYPLISQFNKPFKYVMKLLQSDNINEYIIIPKKNNEVNIIMFAIGLLQINFKKYPERDPEETHKIIKPILIKLIKYPGANL